MRRVLSVAMILATYAVVAELRLLPDPPFAPPSEVAVFMASGEFVGVLLRDSPATILITIASWGAGCALGGVLGITTALAAGRTRILLGMVEFLRSIPSAMWIPFAIVLVGLGAKPAFAVSAGVVCLFMASEIGYSVHLFRRERRTHFRRLGLSWWDRVRRVHVYEMLSVGVPSARVAITISMIVVVIAEMQAGSRYGLGSRLITYQASQRGEAMVAILFIAGTVGLVLNALMEAAEGRLVPWRDALPQNR